jgi:hypothetical protein
MNLKINSISLVLAGITAVGALAAPVKLITLDPGHFHAGLVQKSMIEGVDPVVHVYAASGPELDRHLAMIAGQTHLIL